LEDQHSFGPKHAPGALQKLRREHSPFDVGLLVIRLRVIDVDFIDGIEPLEKPGDGVADDQSNVRQAALAGPVRAEIDGALNEVDSKMIAIGTSKRRKDGIAAVPATEVDDARGPAPEDEIPIEGLAVVAVSAARPPIAREHATGILFAHWA
jgi:hypothetical protein